jgi:uncharacterized membrane protein YfcA
MGYAMDDLNFLHLLTFATAGFAASMITGLAGFAFGIIAAGPWLHVLTPSQTTTLIVAYGLLIQGYSVWKLRVAVKFDRLLPFLVGSAIGVPLGVGLLDWVTAGHLRVGVGIILIAYSLYGLLAPALPKFAEVTKIVDGFIGALGGILGGATGLAGIVVTIWSGLRGWPKDEQRAVFQPVGVVTFAMIAAWLGGVGLIPRDTILLFTIGLPAILAGMWAGLKLYGKLNEAGFRKIVLALLLISGATLVL